MIKWIYSAWYTLDRPFLLIPSEATSIVTMNYLLLLFNNDPEKELEAYISVQERGRL